MFATNITYMRILFLSTRKYPEGGAETVRLHYLAKLFEFAGHEVFIAARGEYSEFASKSYDGVGYISFRGTEKNRLSKILGYLKYNGLVKKYIKDNSFDAVMVAGIPTSTLKYVKKHTKKHGLVLLHDSVEWFSPEQFALRELSLGYRKKQQWMKKLIDRNFKVIAISKYLEKHFSDNGINTVRIPVIMDIDSMSAEKSVKQNKTVVVYAGSPGKKDFLKEIIQGFALLDEEELKKLELRIIGVKHDQLIKTCGVSVEIISCLASSLVLKGRVPRAQVLENLMEADFTVLLRPPQERYAKAGFPTKVVESLASATPVICNLSSDLGDYLTDMENSIIAADFTPQALAAALKKVLALTYEERIAMQTAARKTAQNNFDYRLYLDKLNTLMGKNGDVSL